MKNLLIILLALVFVSCATEEDIQKEEIENETAAIERISGTELAYMQDGEMRLIVSDAELLAAYNNQSAEEGADRVATSFEVFNLGDDYFMRFHNTDGTSSNIALESTNPGNAKLGNRPALSAFGGGKTTCTSTSCASCCGCTPYSTVPYCSPCTVGTKDCSRSTTSDGIQ